MNGEVGVEAARPRPLSGGLWNIFSWLRREDSSSSESLSSVGSTHTAASFAFLGPANYTSATPIVLPPQGPPTDTYKKRLRDRNLRRQQDRDITLHRKYGLYGTYDAFSLPSSRRSIADSITQQERERRASSECLQRRPAHVPGKRRAPQPPLRTDSAGQASLTRRSNRKRRAPQPPAKISERSKENIDNKEWNQIKYNNIINSASALNQMDSKFMRDNCLASIDKSSVGCKSEKYSKKECNSSDKKSRSDKNFIKQLFENKKRNSGYDITPAVRILPSISELDKQAAEIIQACKLLEKNSDSNDKITITSSKSLTSKASTVYRYCNKCLKQYGISEATCPHCASGKINSSYNSENIEAKSDSQNIYTQTEQNVSARHANKIEEKEILKGMLKEMKHSLPKRPKNSNCARSDETRNSFLFKSDGNSTSSLETPTLKVGSSLPPNINISSVCQPSTSNVNKLPSSESKIKKMTKSNDIKEGVHSEKNVLTQPEVVINTQHINKSEENNQQNKGNTPLITIIPVSSIDQKEKLNKIPNKLETKDIVFKENDQSSDELNLHTPLRISSLLNPVYVPKYSALNTQPRNNSGDSRQMSNSLLSSKDKHLSGETDKTTPEPLKASGATVSSNNGCSNILDISRTLPENKKTMQSDKENSEKGLTNFSAVKSTVVSVEAPSGPSAQNISKKSDTSLATSTTFNECKINNSSGNQHSRRRDLIIQLEQSIAKGDEHSAAEAAVKLAQLRLSCSVLSFSSQIINNSSVPMSNKPDEPKLSNKSHIANLKEPSCSKTDTTTIHPVKVGICKDNTKGESKILKTVPEADENYEEVEMNKQVTTQKTTINNSTVEIEVWVEDKEAARGPISLTISRHAVLGELRHQAETSLGLAARLQRWIIGRALCTNDNTPLVSVAGLNFNVPFYLCLVEAGSNEDVASRPNENALKRNNNVYSELMLLEQRALVSNTDKFECEVCMEECAAGDGVVLRECVHSFCRECLSDVIRHCEEPVVYCPALGCLGAMQEREIRALVSPEDYERWLARGLAAAESGTRNAFHCRTRDCTGWALCEPGVQKFPCPVCKHTNCVLCQAIHEGDTCEQHRKKVQDVVRNVDMNQTDEGTKALLESLISKGEALECPECRAIITKKWGCDWVKCSACKTEICWVTRGLRWGPGGRGDTSGGCRCGVDGKRCHPSCGYCH